MNQEQKLSIDGMDYPLSTLSEEAKSQIKRTPTLVNIKPTTAFGANATGVTVIIDGAKPVFASTAPTGTANRTKRTPTLITINWFKFDS